MAEMLVEVLASLGFSACLQSMQVDAIVAFARQVSQCAFSAGKVWPLSRLQQPVGLMALIGN